MRKKMRWITPAIVLAAASATAPLSSAQVQSDVDRFQRQLELIRRDTRNLVNPNVPAEQRSFFDYGMFTTASYLSFDDSDLNNRALRQYDLTAYARLNMDGIHE